VTWAVEVTDEFIAWWDELTERQQEALTARVRLLQERGPALGRPSVDQISQSRHSNMKELRVSHGGTLRVLFAFDPRSTAILLLGGNKGPDGESPEWNGWYDHFVPIADGLFDEHLRLLKEESGS